MQTLDNAEKLWNYHNVAQSLPSEVDFVLAAGSHDDRVAFRAAELILDGLAPLLVVSGGHGKVTRSTSQQTEAERFWDIAVAEGVHPKDILFEDRATNTGHNIIYTRELLEGQDIKPSSGVIVTKPYMKRRALATARKQWSDVDWYVDGPPLSFEEYATDEVPACRMIELMVGDLQRIKVYADKGFQVAQDIPDDVWKAYEELIDEGYARYVLDE